MEMLQTATGLTKYSVEIW